MWINLDNCCGSPTAFIIADENDEVEVTASQQPPANPRQFPQYYPSPSRLDRVRSDDYNTSSTAGGNDDEHRYDDRHDLYNGTTISSTKSKSAGRNMLDDTSRCTDSETLSSAVHEEQRQNQDTVTVKRNPRRSRVALYLALFIGLIILVIAMIVGVRFAVGARNNVDDGNASKPTREPTMPSPTRAPTTPVPSTALFTQEVGGFASVEEYGVEKTTGGEGGNIVTVRDAASFEYFIKRKEPMIVQVDGMIDLSQHKIGMNKTSYRVSANTTIIGVGAASGITGGGIKITGYKACDMNVTFIGETDKGHCMFKDAAQTQAPSNVNPEGNVIIRNLVFTNCSDDCITVQHYAHHVWIDHNDLSRPGDGTIDVKRGTDLVTISWNVFHNAQKTMLLGHNDANGHQDVGRLRVTYHHNFFRESASRNPRIRFADPVHVYNNYFLANDGYGVAAQMDAGVIVEGNFFEDVEVPITTDVGGEPGRIIERFNIYRNSGRPKWGGSGDLAEPDTYYEFQLFNSQLNWGTVPEGYSSGFVNEPYNYYSYRLDDPMVLPDNVPLWAGTGRVA